MIIQSFSTVIFYFMLVFCFLSPHTVSALNLEQVIELAKQNDATFQAEKFESEAEIYGSRRQTSAMGPRVVASFKYLRKEETYQPDDTAEVDESIELKDKDAIIDDGEISISVIQPLIDLTKLNTVRSGLLKKDIAKLRLQKAEEDLVVRAIESYYRILSAEDEIKLANSKCLALAELQKKTKETHRLGLGPVSDQYDVEARYQLALASRISAIAQLEDAREALSELLGMNFIDQLHRNSADSNISMPVYDLGYWLSHAQEDNIDIRIKKLQAESENLDIEIARGKLLPSLNIYADYERQQPDDGLDRYGWVRETVEIGLKFEMELLSSGRDLADFMAHKTKLKSSKKLIDASRRSVARSVKSTWNNLQSKQLMSKAYNKAVTASQKSLEVVQAGYSEGLNTLLDVLNSQRDYFISSSQHQKAGYDFLVEKAKFKQLVGLLVTPKENKK